MKVQFKIASFSLALLILFNSVGVAVFDHTCNFKQETKRSFYKEDTCCKSEKISTSLSVQGLVFEKESCCETHTGFFVSEVFPSQFTSFTTTLHSGLASIEIFQTILAQESLELSSLLFADCSGPPLSVRNDLYSLYESFII